jgi:DNA repair exonuclease SbcCD ATPase subunit
LVVREGDETLAAAHARIQTLEAELERLDPSTRESDERLQALKEEVARLQTERDELARALGHGMSPFEDRDLVIAQLERIAQSGTWRWGHRLANLKWRLTFRQSRDTNAVTQLLERMRARALPPGSQTPSGSDVSPRGDA